MVCFPYGFGPQDFPFDYSHFFVAIPYFFGGIDFCQTAGPQGSAEGRCQNDVFH